MGAKAKSFSKEYKQVVTGFGTSVDFKELGQTVEGIFMKCRKDVGTYGSSVYMINTSEGLVSVWGGCQLDEAFESIQEGATVKIVFQGKVPIEGTKKTINNYDVYQIPPEDVEYEQE
jgi:hypothetical protein